MVCSLKKGKEGVDKELLEAIDRLSESEDPKDQVNKEILRYWNDRVVKNDSAVNRAMRMLIHEYVSSEPDESVDEQAVN